MENSKILNHLKELWKFYNTFNGEDTNTLQLLFSSISGILISVIKIIFGIYLGSVIWIFSGIYAIGLSLARALFTKDLIEDAPLKKKNKTVLAIAIILMVSAFVFDICAMFRQFQGEMGRAFAVWMVIPLSLYFVASYILAIKGLFRTRKNKSLSFYAFRVICISGALMNMVLLQRMILSLTSISIEWLIVVNSIFSYFIGGTLLVTALILMLKAIFAIRRI